MIPEPTFGIAFRSDGLKIRTDNEIGIGKGHRFQFVDMTADGVHAVEASHLLNRHFALLKPPNLVSYCQL